MDLWTFQRFQQPRLCVDAVDHEKGNRIVRLRSGTLTYSLAFDDDDAAARIAEDLKTLRDSAAPLWTTLRDSPPETGWHFLGTFLDTHSLIAEGRDGAADQLTGQAHRIRSCVEETVTAVLKGLSDERRLMAGRHAAALRHRMHRAPSVFETADDPFDAARQPNFFLALLAIEFEYFRGSSPLTLAAADLLLALVANEADDNGTASTSQSVSDVAGLYDERDLATHLWLVGSALVSSTNEDSIRFPTALVPTPSLSSGLELMRQIEILARETLTRWGENPYITTISKLDGTDAPLVAGTSVEQYFVTTRFVEIIAPLLSKRLAAPLRSMMSRYYSEEYGHEVLDGATCEALGVTRAALGKALPLPLHFAFVDVLTLLADRDPISSFAAIMVTEGIFGEPPRMSVRPAAARENGAFGKLSGDHEELNLTLNHNSISRDVFEQITAVSPARQAATMRRILFLIELNHRAWIAITDFYGQQDQLWLQGDFGRPLSPQG